MNFCKSCQNLLQPIEIDGKVVYFCNICKKTSKLKSNIILKSEQVTSKVNMKLIYAALYDDTLPRKEKKCKNCKNNILIYRTNIKTMRNTYICRNCQKFFMLSSK